MSEHNPMTEAERNESFQRFVADQLKQQTQALLTIKTIMVAWVIVTVLAVVILAVG